MRMVFLSAELGRWVGLSSSSESSAERRLGGGGGSGGSPRSGEGARESGENWTRVEGPVERERDWRFGLELGRDDEVRKEGGESREVSTRRTAECSSWEVERARREGCSGERAIALLDPSPHCSECMSSEPIERCHSDEVLLELPCC